MDEDLAWNMRQWFEQLREQDESRRPIIMREFLDDLNDDLEPPF